MTVETSVLVNVPNMLSFVRFLMIALMIVNMRRRPIMVFFLCFGSGLVDMIDGRVARYFNETSPFGALTDICIDRLTTQAQYFVLAAFFPRYSMLFMVISTVEIVSDLARCRASLFLSQLKIILPTTQNAQSENWKWLLSMEPLAWYTSDLFYWLLYFSAFVPKSTTPKLLGSSVNDKSTSSSSRCSTIRTFFRDFNYTFNAFYLFLADFIYIKFGMRINFEMAFKPFIFVCLCGAALKTWINISNNLTACSVLLSVVAK